jgi:hypothetical protein
VPSVFILGAPKSGTSTLTDMLWQHPAHVPPMMKELMYLQRLPEFVSNYEQSRLLALLWGRYANGHSAYSLAGYRKFFPTRGEMRRRRALERLVVTSDCDPFNLYCPVARQRIREFAVQPKFVMSFRNPVDRAYSDYNMHRPGEPRTFEEVIDDELSGRERRFRKRFLNQSIYAPHVENWFKVFPRQQFLIIRAEDLFQDPRQVARELFAFLDLPDCDVRIEPQNVGRYGDTLSQPVRMRLHDYFKPHNDRLDDVLGRDMGWNQKRTECTFSTFN